MSSIKKDVKKQAFPIYIEVFWHHRLAKFFRTTSLNLASLTRACIRVISFSKTMLSLLGHLDSVGGTTWMEHWNGPPIVIIDTHAQYNLVTRAWDRHCIVIGCIHLNRYGYERLWDSWESHRFGDSPPIKRPCYPRCDVGDSPVKVLFGEQFSSVFMMEGKPLQSCRILTFTWLLLLLCFINRHIAETFDSLSELLNQVSCVKDKPAIDCVHSISQCLLLWKWFRRGRGQWRKSKSSNVLYHFPA